MNKEFKHPLLFVLMLSLLSSCTGLKRLQPGQVLYSGYELELLNDSLLDNSSKLVEDLEEFIVPEPNLKLLWMRPNLSLHLSTKEPKKEGKGTRHLLKHVLGSPPVLMEQVNPQNIAEQLEGRLFNLGYFESTVDYEVVTDSQLATVRYTLNLQPRYRVSELSYPIGKGLMATILAHEKKNSLLLPQSSEEQVFTLDLLSEERLRLVNVLQDKGFYYMQEDYLLFKVDSTLGNHRLHVLLTLKKNIPERARRAYHISKVIVNPMYSFGDSSFLATKCTGIKGMSIYGNDSVFKASMLSEHIYIEKDSLYKKAYRELSLQRLISLGVFDFVNVRYEEDTSHAYGLVARVELSPSKRMSIRSELKVATKSNGFTGPGFDFSFIDRNLFKGAEYFKLSFETGYETQLGASQQQGLNSYLLGVNAEYRFPKVLSMIKANTRRFNETAPQTRYKLGFRTLNRVSFYQLNSLDFLAGFIWKPTFRTRHELNAANLNYLVLPNTSSEFEAKLAENKRLRQSFESQFIFGPSYYFTYSNQGEKRSLNTFFRGGVDFSGNILSTAKLIQTGNTPTSNDPFTIAGLPYSQYTRFETDLRLYYHLSEKSDIAYRAFVGAGLPYGNSSTLPFVKQYFTGGASDNRGFAARSVGPGSFSPSLASDSVLNFIDQTGDIKLQTNLEYRFHIVSILYGVLFTDISNVWLTNADVLRPGSRFSAGRFINEFAVSTGAGFRLDVSLFILRFDMGVPLLDPRLPVGDRFIAPKLASSTYRSEHLIYTIAIGYPF